VIRVRPNDAKDVALLQRMMINDHQVNCYHTVSL